MIEKKEEQILDKCLVTRYLEESDNAYDVEITDYH
jgi:hypothetical protein